MKKRTLALILIMMLATFMAAGCGAQKEAPAQEPEQPAAEELLVIGGDVQTEYTKTCKLTNATGMDITGFSVKESSAAEYPENMMPLDSVWKNGEAANLNFTPENAEALYDDTEGEGEKALDPQFTAVAVFSDGTQLEWFAVPFDDMQEAQLCKEGDILYVIYTSVSTGEEINTLEAAKASVQMAEEAAAAATSTQQTEQKADAAASKPAASGSTSKPASSTSKPASSSSSSSSSGGGDNGCVGNEGLVYGGDGGSSGGSSGGGSSSGGGDNGCIGDDGLTY